ncbi:AraC family transcriptional regulator [Nocardioides sp. W3-2-3]|uniref:AraC family transcriptional regulator n=1 Tax=Nocardioides convexus TaxID=2712224 RepID=UPI0024187DE0|nr:helix-turn-helix domain-containing protein [Nocardioides convexus]NHA01302.1 AraC family transcriptional regulator [Nocardioides convexus]
MLQFQSESLEETEEFLSEQYAPMRIGSTTADAPSRMSRVASDLISVDRLDFAFEMTYDVAPLGRIGLCDIATGTIEGHGPEGAGRESFGPGDLFVLSPPDRGYGGTINRARYTVTMIDPDVLSAVAAGSGEAPVTLLDHRPTGAAAAARLRAAIEHFDLAVLGDPVAAGNPLILGQAARYVAAHVLSTFRTSAVGAVSGDSRDAHPAALRRAIAFIEERPGDDITPAQIAAAAHVSIRSLQLAFRRHLDTTPMAYLREVRMTRTHRDLTSGTVSGGDSVAEIAGRWGFSHHGHFGQAYRRAYGETPGETLRR